MRIREQEREREQPIDYEDTVEGEVYMTNGGGGDAPDGAYYLAVDGGGFVELSAGEYYHPEYSNEYDGWKFWPVNAELVVRR